MPTAQNRPRSRVDSSGADREAGFSPSSQEVGASWLHVCWRSPQGRKWRNEHALVPPLPAVTHADGRVRALEPPVKGGKPGGFELGSGRPKRKSRRGASNPSTEDPDAASAKPTTKKRRAPKKERRDFRPTAPAVISQTALVLRPTCQGDWRQASERAVPNWPPPWSPERTAAPGPPPPGRTAALSASPSRREVAPRTTPVRRTASDRP
jgi:hypothetical protein